MSGLKLVSVRHGPQHKSLVLYSSMPREEAERLLSAAFGVPDGAALQLMDPVSRRRWSVLDACRDTAALPDVVDLVTSQSASAAAAAQSQPAFSAESRPLLHHSHHSHRVQPYQPHNRQQSRTAHQLTQQMIDDIQQQQLPLSPLPASPSASLFPQTAATAISFPPPFVLSLHSLTDLAQALQLSEHLIVLLFIVSPASASSTALSRLYHQLATSSMYRHLLFVSVESSLLASAASVAASASAAPLLLPVSLPPPPALQLYYAGTCIGEVANVNEHQLITIVHSSDELMQHIAANNASTDNDDSSSSSISQQQQLRLDSPSGRVQWEEGEEEEGVLLSAEEAVALEKLVLREDSGVLQAYSAFPELSLVVDAFMRIAKHVGREKEARRRRAGERDMERERERERERARTRGRERDTVAAMAASAAAAASSSFPRPGASSAMDDLLSMTLSALQQHGLLSAAEVDGVLQLYSRDDQQVLQTLLAYQRDGREEQLMENLLRIAMAHKLGMTAQLAYSPATDTAGADNSRARSSSSGSGGRREWEGRDDSEGMRERRMAASRVGAGAGSSATRSKWATQPQRTYKPIAFNNEEDEEEDGEEEEDEDEDEEREQADEDEEADNEDDEQYEDDSAAALNTALGRLGIAALTSSLPPLAPSTAASSSAVPLSSGVSARLYEDAVSLLAALSFQQLISSEQLSLFVTLLTQQHPLLLSALLAYEHSNDVDDLLNTLNKVHKRLADHHSHSDQQQQQQASTSAITAAAAPRVVEVSGESAELAELLSRLPPSFLATHGSHLSALIGNRDAVLLSALQIWREQQQQRQADHSGRDTERHHKDTQQLLTIVMRRAEKERQRAETTHKAQQQQSLPPPTASATVAARPSSSHFSSAAQPQSPLSPQVTADQVEQLKHAYSSGVQQQQQNRPLQPLHSHSHKPPPSTALPADTVHADSRPTEVAPSAAQLERSLSRLLSGGVLSTADCSLLRSRLADGDARMLAVLQVAAADGDEDELGDSLTRIAHSQRTAGQDGSTAQQTDGNSNTNSGGGEDRPASHSTQPASAQPTGSEQSSEAGGAKAASHDSKTGRDSAQQQPVAVAAAADVTVEDVPVEADGGNDIATAPVGPQHNSEEEQGRTAEGGEKSVTSAD